MRFLDTDLGDEADPPCRMVKTIDSNLVSMDSACHEVESAVSDVINAGSFDDDTWCGSAREFDWTRVDRFEILVERGLEIVGAHA